MHRPIQRHLRSQAIAYVALFVALGGTSYAALNIPRNSVGTRQLRNGAVTAKKLDRRSITGYVAFWARIDSAGQVLASSSSATTTGWSTGIGNITFHGDLPRNCFALANIGHGGDFGAHVGPVDSGSLRGSTTLQVGMSGQNGLVGPEPVDVAEICP